MRTGAVKIMFRLSGMVKPLAHIMLLAVILGTAGFLCSSFMPICGAYALLEVMGFSTGFKLSHLLLVIPLLAVLRGLLRYGEQICGHYIAFKLLAIIRNQVFQALCRLAPARMEGWEKGNLIAVISSDIELLEVFYAHTIAPVAIAVITSLLMTWFIASFNIFLAAYALTAYLIVGLIIPRALTRIGTASGISYRDKLGALNSFYLDSLRGIREIMQYGQGDQRLQEIRVKTDEINKYQKVLKNHEGTVRAVSDTAVLLFSLGMILASAIFYLQGKLDFVGVLILTVTMFSTFGPVVALSSLSNNLLRTIASGRRVLSVLDEVPAVAEVADGQWVAFKNMQCENLSFTYDDEAVLKKVNLTIPRNKIVAINGKSGSGKSTLLKLMMRFWDAGGGMISISEQNIRDINTTVLRDMESYVTQETWLFHDTIENNIKIAQLDASPDEIERAAKKAALHDFVMSLPQGYQTQVGELGAKLSSGERQRIGIARAFLHDSPLILLDEPTSNLDSLNEAQILRSLKNECHDKTVVLVSHRDSTMKIADNVYSMNSGRLS